MNLDFLKNRIQELEKKHTSNELNDNDTKQLKVSYVTLNNGVSVSGVILSPIDKNGNKQDFLVIKELFKFGSKYIEKTENNLNTISDIDKLEEYISKFKSNRDYQTSYSSLENLYIPLFNANKEPCILILNVRYYTRITQVLKQFYKILEDVGEDIFNYIINFTMNKQEITITLKNKVESQKLESIFKEKINNYEKTKFLKSIYNVIYKKKELSKEDIRAIISTWVAQNMKLFGNTSISVPNVKATNLVEDEDFFNKKQEVEEDSSDDDFFSSKAQPVKKQEVPLKKMKDDTFLDDLTNDSDDIPF